jgi:monoamine oxidase
MTDQKKEAGGNVSRRDTFVLGATAAAIAALPAVSAAASTRSRPARVDVILVGAGFAGLTAARDLRRAGKSVIILEADNRVGGRTKPGLVAGERVDIGGQWVGPTQTELLALAAEYGVASIEQYADGDNIIDINGHMARYKGETPALPPADLEAFGALVAQLDGYANQIAMPKPWLVDQADAWDAHTVESWMQTNVTSESVRALMRVLVRAVFSTETGQCSFLYFLSYLASAGGLEALISTRGGAQDQLFPDSLWQIADKVAAELRQVLVLEAPVSLIEHDDEGVRVTTAKGVWSGDRVIVTAPPPMAARIDYIPPMPARRDGLTQRMPMGCVIKVVIAYEKPFWRDQGLSGLVLSDKAEFGPWLDRVTPLTRGGALVGFFDGGPAQDWADRPAEERRAKVLSDIALYFGDEALAPTDYLEEVWTRTPLTRGGYVAVPGPGVLTAFGEALAEPVGRIHWAGTETSDVWVGYVDGAIRSGKRAAAEVLRVL